MTNMITHTANTDAVLMLKTTLVKETVRSLLVLKNHQFDLSTTEGIHYAVNCTVDSLLQQKIENAEIHILDIDNTIGTAQ